TAAVLPPGSGMPTGTVTFTDGVTMLGSASLSGGQATFTTSSLAAGSHSIVAMYGGDASFTGNTSAAVTETVSQPPSPPSGPFPLPQRVFVTAADAGGGPDVKVFNADGSFRAGFFAYDPAFTGGVRIAVGDVNGDGYPDVICAAGPGGGPNVIAFSGKDR